MTYGHLSYDLWSLIIIMYYLSLYTVLSIFGMQITLFPEIYISTRGPAKPKYCMLNEQHLASFAKL